MSSQVILLCHTCKETNDTFTPALKAKDHVGWLTDVYERGDEKEWLDKHKNHEVEAVSDASGFWSGHQYCFADRGFQLREEDR